MPSASEIPESVKIQGHVTQLHIEEWLKEDFLQLRWWILIALILVSLLVWWKLLDKSRLKETVLFTAVAIIFSLGLHEYGEELVLWDYPVDLIPIFPPLTSVNLIMLPLAFSFVYQKFTAIKGFMIASAIVSAVFCFVLEPVFEWGGLYEQIYWQYYYSLPLYFGMALLVRLLTIKIFKITEKHKRRLRSWQ